MAPGPGLRIAALERDNETLRNALREAQEDADRAHTVSAQLAAALTLFGDHAKVALNYGSKDVCSCCFEKWPCQARLALDVYAKTKATP